MYVSPALARESPLSMPKFVFFSPTQRVENATFEVLVTVFFDNRIRGSTIRFMLFAPLAFGVPQRVK